MVKIQSFLMFKTCNNITAQTKNPNNPNNKRFEDIFHRYYDFNQFSLYLFCAKIHSVILPKVSQLFSQSLLFSATNFQDFFKTPSILFDLIQLSSFSVKFTFNLNSKNLIYYINLPMIQSNNQAHPITFMEKLQSNNSTNFQQTQESCPLILTPIRTKTFKPERCLQTSIQLSPLINPGKFLSSNLTSPRHFKPFRMEIVQTPVYNKASLGFSLLQNQGQQDLQTISIHKKMIFNTEEVNQSSMSSSNESEKEQENQEKLQSQNQQGDSEEFHKENKQYIDSNQQNQNYKLKRNIFERQNLRQTIVKSHACNCKKTQCLKLYCDCFREGEVCGLSCNCIGCHNIVEYDEKRLQIMQQLNKRNPQAFKPKIQDHQHSKGCNCKKTSCMKKYCECYQAGLSCGDYCKCQQCKNLEEKLIERENGREEEGIRRTVKKQFIMREYE